MLHLRRLLIFSHRYLGIAISLMVVVWFASGIVMMYAGGMPEVDPQWRLERLPPLDFARVKLSPHDAAQRAGEAGVFGRLTLTTVLDRPAYRFQGRRSETVFADTGATLESVDIDMARNIASRFLDVPGERVQFVHSSDGPDQWTIGMRGEFHKFRIADDAATQVYVSAQTGEIEQLTTRTQRALAWIGTIPHWLYFTALRTNQPLWYRIIVWLSALACMLAVLGIILTFTQFRRTQPFRWSLAVPYRGWMRWHYILGASFGVFALTWAFSGLVSMEPFAWTNARGLDIRRDAFTGGEMELARFGAIDGAALARTVGGRSIKEIGFTRIHGEDYYTVAATDDATTAVPRERLHVPYSVGPQGGRSWLLISASAFKVRDGLFSKQSVVERLQSALPSRVRIVEQTVLDEYDSYYYSRTGQAPLPVLRIKFDDPTRTWIYVDLHTSSIVSQVHRYSRLERWLFNGLHSLDFKFWYSKRPWWDIGMLVLLLGGLAMSTLGLYLGIKRLIRDLRPSRDPQQTAG